MPIKFRDVSCPQEVLESDWESWQWQLKNSLLTESDFHKSLGLSDRETAAFRMSKLFFKVRTTPYYGRLIRLAGARSPLRQILLPDKLESLGKLCGDPDPLSEKRYSPFPRLVHRYSDRVLLLATDTCAIYCRYCTRKRFTATGAGKITLKELQEIIGYIKKRPGIREVILSGGDPLILSDEFLDILLEQLRKIDHLEVIRVSSRLPVVCPMRVTESLVKVFKKYKPVYLMTHFNHPKEITKESARALEQLVDSGIPVLNQMVLLNGINNHPAVVQALLRRLVYLRVKPYYMFQCDLSEGTDHLRTTLESSLELQRELWGHISGLMMPNFCVDIPGGGGKAILTPDSRKSGNKDYDVFQGWDGVRGKYLKPLSAALKVPTDVDEYSEEWLTLKGVKNKPSNALYRSKELD